MAENLSGNTPTILFALPQGWELILEIRRTNNDIYQMDGKLIWDAPPFKKWRIKDIVPLQPLIKNIQDPSRMILSKYEDGNLWIVAF